MNQVFLQLGSNLGEREHLLFSATTLINDKIGFVTKCLFDQVHTPKLITPKTKIGNSKKEIRNNDTNRKIKGKY